MYDKFFLSQKQIQLIQKWSINKPLFIYGSPGIGKTSLAKEILKDTMLTVIDSGNIRNSENLYEFILNIIQKKNITMMFQKQKKRGIIIDNFDVFNRCDKKNFKYIINLLETYNYYGTKIIVIFEDKLLKNRSIAKIDSVQLYLSYSKNYYLKIINNILNELNLKLSVKNIQKLIHKSNYNLHTVYSILNYDQKKTNNLIQSKDQFIDNFDSTELLYEHLFTKKMNCNEIIQNYLSDENIISLNLLENISNYIHKIDQIIHIYQSFEISNIFDIQTVMNHDYKLKDYSCLMKIYTFHLLIRSENIKKCNYPIYNKYISRSLILTHSKKNYLNYNSKYKNIIYLYLYTCSKKINNKYLQQIMKCIHKKELEYYMKEFNFFYNSKLKIKDINKFK